MGIDHDGLPHRRDADAGNPRHGGDDSFYSRQLAYALARLRAALAAVDGLLTIAGAGPSSECNAYPLGEASHVMHYALVMLGECTSPGVAMGVTAGLQ